MFARLINPLQSKSFFLFGARGVGKTTFVRNFFAGVPTLNYDLLDPEIEDRFAMHPEAMRDEIMARKGTFEWVIIDEVQKCPRLLNVVHKLISEHKFKFVLTGSSARRLRQKGVNLLAGRALTEFLFPLTHIELGDRFDLSEILMRGALPEVVNGVDVTERNAFLRSYALNYLKQEIQAEQWVRKLDPFRKFLVIAAQMNGKILNYTSIAQDVGVETNTIQSYFDILEDTLIGNRLPAFDRSVRKQQRKAPKFYFFDLGIKRALDRTLDVPLRPGTYDYGHAFEHFIVMEFYRLSAYKKSDYELSYLLTKDGAEIDLIIDRPGKPLALIEIKSKDQVDERDIKSLEHFKEDFPGAERFLVSNDPRAKQMRGVSALPWRQGVAQIVG